MRFQTLDRNEDGNLNYEEFKKLFEARAAMINGNAESQVCLSEHRLT